MWEKAGHKCGHREQVTAREEVIEYLREGGREGGRYKRWACHMPVGERLNPGIIGH